MPGIFLLSWGLTGVVVLGTCRLREGSQLHGALDRILRALGWVGVQTLVPALLAGGLTAWRLPTEVLLIFIPLAFPFLWLASVGGFVAWAPLYSEQTLSGQLSVSLFFFVFVTALANASWPRDSPPSSVPLLMALRWLLVINSVLGLPFLARAFLNG